LGLASRQHGRAQRDALALRRDDQLVPIEVVAGRDVPGEIEPIRRSCRVAEDEGLVGRQELALGGARPAAERVEGVEQTGPGDGGEEGEREARDQRVEASSHARYSCDPLARGTATISGSSYGCPAFSACSSAG